MEILMYRHFRPVIIAACLALATTALSSAANPLGGPSTSGGPAIANSGGGITSPGDAFNPHNDAGPQIGTVSPPATGARERFPCTIYFDEEGHAHMIFENHTTTDYPVGTKVTFKYSNGDDGWIVFTIYPFWSGADTEIALPWKYKAPLDCTADVQLPEEDVPH
jgi:hypothetical protein